ncbi:TPA: hypothetical protein ACS5QX_002029, partial [Legionella pneumophila]
PISFVLVNKFDHESVCTSISFPIFVNVHFKKVTAQLNDRIPQRLRGHDRFFLSCTEFVFIKN